MPTRVNKVETTVYSVIFNVASVQTRLILEVLVISFIDIVYEWLPTRNLKL